MIKVGFVGCGGIMQVHYKHLSAMDDVKLVGHCDIEKDRAERGAAEFGGEAFTEFEAMYDKTKPDAVYVAVPPYAHCGMEEAAAERGIHLFIEKPIAINRDVAKRIASVVTKANIICSVGYCFRYYDTIAIARQALKGKAISLISGHWHGGMPGVWWWRRMDGSGGQVVEQTTHMFDLLRYLCGEVAEVHAVASTGCMTKVEHFDVHDSSVVSLRLKNGATGVVSSTCVARHGGGVGVEIVTSDNTVSFAGGRVTVREDGQITEYLPKVDMYAEENKAFIEAVRTGKKNRVKSSFNDALKTFLVTYAANESMASGLPVKP